MTEYPVHPVAKLFPMLPPDDLADLAEDIAANGLLHPIIRDDDGQIIDGRNRLAACLLAEVAPRWEELGDRDPVAVILSANVQRRHLSKGQAAMAVAQAQALSGQKLTAQEAAAEGGVSKARVVQANVVREWAPDLADGVLSGAEKLDAAYDTARQRKDAASSVEACLARLQEVAPDLAVLVVEERMTVREADAAWREREREALRLRQLSTQLVATAVRGLAPGGFAPGEWLRGTCERWAPELLPGVEVTPGQLRAASANLAAFAEWLEEGTDGANGTA